MLISDKTEILETNIGYREVIVETASEFIGSLSVRYVYDRPDLGQSPENGFDCSGFVRFVLTKAGLEIPDFVGLDNNLRPIRHASEFWDHYGVNIHDQLRQPGDLLFFSRHGDVPTHIGIVRDPESYIHAPGMKDTKVRVEAIEPQPIVPRRPLYGRRLYAVNPIGYKAPTILDPASNYRSHQIIL